MILILRRSNSFGLAYILLAGCFSMTEKEKGESIIATPRLEKSIKESQKSGLFAISDWPEEKWWEMFSAPKLNAWIECAYEQNPSLIAVKNRFEQARQIAHISRSKLFPFLYFDASDNWRYLSKNGFTHLLNPSLPLNGNQVDLSLSFTYEFDFWGKYRHLFKASMGEALAKEAEIYQTKLILSTALAQAYFAISISMQKKILYENLYELEKAKWSLQERMFQKALSNRLKPLFDQEKVHEANQFILAIDDEIKMQRHLINIIMGKGPDEDLQLQDAELNLPDAIEIPKNIPLELLSRRPDLMAQIWRVEAMANYVGAAKADFLPNINLAAFAGLQSLSFANLFSLPSKTWGMLPALTLPVYTSGAIKANVLAKKAAFEEAIFQYNELILKSVQEVADVLINLQTAYEQKILQQFIVEESKERLDLTTLRFEKGLDSAFDLYDYQIELIQKKLKDLDLLYSQFAFLVRLSKALGGGYKSPIQLPVQRVGES